MSIIYDGTLFGDTPCSLGRHARAGSQELSGDTNSVIGDANALRGHAVGGNDTISGALLLALGDARTISDHAHGGNDMISGYFPDGPAYGDALTITGHGRGGDDQVTNGTDPNPEAYGDADVISGHGRGGNDHVSVSSTYTKATGYGDARLLTGHARGGDDRVEGNGHSDLFGDADTLSGFATGGDDVLSNINDSSKIYGDGRVLKDHAKGGDDTLSGAAVAVRVGNDLYGDGEQLLGRAQGGNDVLLSDTLFAPDRMWGDAAVVDRHAQTGADRFVIMEDSGHDHIMDFERGKDHIDLSDFGFTRFSDVAGLLHTTADGTLISFDAQSDVLVHGVGRLGAGDFLFA